MAQVTPEPIELSHDQRVATPQRLQAGIEARARVALARCRILIDMVGIDAGRDQGIALKVMDLATIGFRNSAQVRGRTLKLRLLWYGEGRQAGYQRRLH